MSTGCQDVKNDVKIVILTSCTRVVLHPLCKMTFPSPGRVHGNSVQVCKNSMSNECMADYYLYEVYLA